MAKSKPKRSPRTAPERAAAAEPRVPDDAALRAAIRTHVERNIGPVTTVFQAHESPLLHIDILHVPATAARPFQALVTCGMSARAMRVPREALSCRYAELFLLLPSWWPVNLEDFRDESHYWPFRLLKELAPYPHRARTWLGPGHTLPNGDPPEPYAPTTHLCGVLLTNPNRLGESFELLTLPGGEPVYFWQLVPLYAEEMKLKVEHGADALLALLNRHRVPEVITPRRRNVCDPSSWLAH